jgi:hypothetical protein
MTAPMPMPQPLLMLRRRRHCFEAEAEIFIQIHVVYCVGLLFSCSVHVVGENVVVVTEFWNISFHNNVIPFLVTQEATKRDRRSFLRDEG